MSKIPESKNRIDEANEILLEYVKDCSLIDEGNLYFAATEFKSAYEQLQKQNQELKETLKFYADGDNWEHVAPDKVDYRVIEKSDFGTGEFQLTELTDDEWVGGRRAREVLAKYQKGDLK